MTAKELPHKAHAVPPIYHIMDMLLPDIIDVQVLAGWIVIVGGIYIYLDLRRRNKKRKEQRQPKYKSDKTDHPH
ncbi:MAG: hypothetical protein HGB36_13045 [Chlorobiaceae bacterium]|nr:hypothetical protein [Chlorobiaceae bacterium]